MRKKQVILYTLLLTLSIISLLLLQVYWFKNAYKLKEQQFDQDIRNALTKVVSEMEEMEIREYIMNNYSYKNLFLYDTLFNIWINDMDKDFDNISSDNALKQDFDIIKGKEVSNFFQEQILISNDTIRETISENIKKIYDKFLNKQYLILKVFDDFIRVQPKIEERITPQAIEKIIRESFNHFNLNLPFEFAITKWDNIIVYKTKGFNIKSRKIYKIKLFPHDIHSEKNFLLVEIPQMPQFIISSMKLMLFASIILSIILVFCFGITLFLFYKEKKLQEVRNEFISNMTHELKTPISTIFLASQLICDETIPAEKKNINHLARVIHDESKKLSSQVEKVLQLAIFEKKLFELKIRETNVHELIENVVQSFDIQVRHKKGSIKLELEAKQHIIPVDSVHFSNILTNLLDNALKYCERTPEIIIKTCNNDDYFIMQVKDNGIGISKQDLKKIFDKFYRVSTGNIHNVKGFGVGLSYVKKIVEEHNGRVEVESKLYEGSNFKIYLPIKNNSYGKDKNSFSRRR